jgi:hypothetical protein
LYGARFNQKSLTPPGLACKGYNPSCKNAEMSILKQRKSFAATPKGFKKDEYPVCTGPALIKSHQPLRALACKGYNPSCKNAEMSILKQRKSFAATPKGFKKEEGLVETRPALIKNH